MLKSQFPFPAYAAGLLILGLVVLASLAFDIPVRQLTIDPAQAYKGPFYIGFLSNLTVITWAIGAYCALFARWTINQLNGNPEWSRFFGLAAILSIILMLDDAYMFHEQIFPDYLFFPKLTGLRPNEKFVIGGYGIFAAWFVYSSRHTIRKTPWLQLAVAGVLLASSILVDRGIGKMIIPVKQARVFAEDGTKFLGVLGWSIYLVNSGKGVITQLLANRNSTGTSAEDTVADI